MSAAGSFDRADPIGLRGGRNLLSYAEGNPVVQIDPLGLTVYRCCAPAQIMAGLVDHCWLKTDTREAGLGNLDEGQPSGQAVPGGQCDSPYLAQTQIVDHTGASKSRPGARCEEVKNVDEECVNKLIWTDRRGYGSTKGAFSLFNNCQGFVNGVLGRCKKPVCRPLPPSDNGKRYF
jgi:uncharacterized protein RhaS with RHS repeats